MLLNTLIVNNLLEIVLKIIMMLQLQPVIFLKYENRTFVSTTVEPKLFPVRDSYTCIFNLP